MVKGEDDKTFQRFNEKYNNLINNDIKKQNNIPHKRDRYIDVTADNHEKKSHTNTALN